MANRLGDGTYEFGGETHQLALTEPAKSNALHGLVRWRSWHVVEHHRPNVVMTTTIHPMTGFPFCLVVSVDYRLAVDGLTVTTTATNASATACPYGAGQHPYLSPGNGLIDAPFTDLDRDETGRARVRLSPPDGCSAELWVDEHYPILELYTGDTLAPDRRRRGLGAEPMTCPPDAFRTGDEVIRLEPGESIATVWGARHV